MIHRKGIVGVAAFIPNLHGNRGIAYQEDERGEQQDQANTAHIFQPVSDVLRRTGACFRSNG